jgi:hypothetical protein
MIQRFKILKDEYRIVFKLSLIASLTFCILMFLFFPHISPPPLPPKEYQALLFTINDIAPNTAQKNITNPKPPEPKIFTPDVVDEPEILPDQEIISQTKSDESGSGMSTLNTSGSGTALDMPELQFVPRQILEVLPKNVDKNAKGFVELSLKIGTDGHVIEHKIIDNTTGSQQVLQSVITAAYKSKWEPVKINNNKIVYWVEKTYSFN